MNYHKIRNKTFEIFCALALLMPLSSTISYAQQITGRVFEQIDNKELPARGAFVHWINQTAGTVTDSNGYFALSTVNGSNKFVVQSVISMPDTITLVPGKSNYKVVLKPGSEILQAATATGKRKTYGLNSLDPKTTINLNEREFQKAACCNLSESFENAPAIDVNYGDAVTGTRQIKMLGLDGFYSMISREFMPSVRLLNSYYGMSFIPAAWVKGIQITKGAGSVVNGYESIAGQINIEMKKPFDNEKIMFDQFVSESGRSETDLMYRKDINSKLASSIFVRSAFYPVRQDRNNDGFMDNPTGKQFQVMNRWQFVTSKLFEGEFSASYNKDQKDAGQTAFFDKDWLSNSFYGIGIDNEQFDVWAKLGRVFKDKPYQSFGSQYGYNQSKIKSSYGKEGNPFLYEAIGKSFYANLMFQSIIKTTTHGYKVGISTTIDDLNESVGMQNNQIEYDRLESVVGGFVEYTYLPNEHFSVVAGLRSDYNTLYGLTVTPRLHSRYNFNKEKTTLRVSGGMGRRTSNIFGQNQQMFASNRFIKIISDNNNLAYGLEQEVAINSGVSLEHKFKLGLRNASILLDYFNTTFLNEVVFDRELNESVRFYNMKNGTRANSFQAQLDLNPLRRTELRFAYRLFDVTTLYRVGRLDKPFVARNRGFMNITQSTRNKWQFSSTLQAYGKQRIPGTSYLNGAEPVLLNNYSPAFLQLNAQISKRFTSSFETFVGVENLLNYKQKNPIINAEAPFSSGFDASLIWGPVFGRMVYGGFRWRLTDR